MKKVLLIPVLLLLSISLASAQNSVTVTQHGNGNNVTINQSTVDSWQAKNQTGCNQASKNMRGNSNKIFVKRVDGMADTLTIASEVQRNVVKEMLGKQKLAASQYGKSNGLYIVLSDSQKSYKKFKSTQKGSQNQITAHLNNNIHDVTILQSGNKNNIAINPCNGQKASAGQEGNSIKITQKGSGNSATIVQN